MSDSGTLLLRVFTSRGEFPVQDASIFVTHHGNEGRDLLALRVSDPNGAAPPIQIPSPAPEQSQSPQGDTPYALCDVWAEHQGYQLLVVQGVQIFPGVTSIQDLPLIPQNPADGIAVDQVDITPQDL